MKIFISYAHEEDAHNNAILALAEKLIRDGLETDIDAFHPFPPEGWSLWMEKSIRSADFVLSVCTSIYRDRVNDEAPANVGKGARWEGRFIREEIYRDSGKNRKFVPLLKSGGKEGDIPTVLSGYTYFYFESEEGYESLYRFLTNQPAYLKPTPGTIRTLPPKNSGTPQTSGNAPPTSFTPNLPNNMRDRMSSGLSLEDVNVIWFELFATNCDDELPQHSRDNRIIVLITRAKQRNLNQNLLTILQKNFNHILE